MNEKDYLMNEKDGFKPEEDDSTYSVTFAYKCPTDFSDVSHDILYKKATCTRVDDTIIRFRCSRNSQCVKCQQNYL